MNTLLVIEGCFPLPVIDRYLGLLNVDRQHCVVSDSDVLTKTGAYTNAVLCVSRPLQRNQLTALYKCLSPGANVLFSIAESIEVLRRNCILSGFMTTEDKLEDTALLKMKKPEWTVGSKSIIPSVVPSKWTIAPDDEILDDDDFLTEEDKAPVTSSDKAPVKKACANCTCGRAEGKEPVKLTQSMIDHPVTSCGSCGMGDAYRCASCPYRGLPSFEAGKKIELPEGFLIPDL